MKTNFPPLYYSDYLQLDALLSSQHPKSLEYSGKLAHDEVLFIIVHQAYELWFKQIIHELDSIIGIFKNKIVGERQMGTAVARLARITEIQKVLVEQIRILESMTPLDFLEFRDYLVPASGFQSFQFRIVENKLGLKRQQRKLFDKRAYFERLSEEHQKLILDTENDPSIYDLVEKWLERTPFLKLEGFDFWQNYQKAVRLAFKKDEEIIKNNPVLSERDRERELHEIEKAYEDFAALFDEKKHQELREKGFRRLSYKAMQGALLINLFRDEPILQMPFRFLTHLVEIDELFTTWRYRHALMVHRMIGQKIGTGGSSGQQYLKVTADSHKIFTDLTNLSTFLIPRSDLPELPEDFRRNLGFYYHHDKK